MGASSIVVDTLFMVRSKRFSNAIYTCGTKEPSQTFNNNNSIFVSHLYTDQRRKQKRCKRVKTKNKKK